MFNDTAKVFIKSGDGGTGAITFRHEKYIDRGGPDGGDGGKGGNVIFQATTSVDTLVDFRYSPRLTAENGGAGSYRQRHGKNGEDLIVKVPVGTILKRDDDTIADLDSDGAETVVAKGGFGGFGNEHFKSSIKRAPHFAEKGEPGESFELNLELKLLADVGLVGFPNAGKSTFLSVVSNAKPEIANYEFTTLKPQLGVAKVDDREIVIADIPGLIEGAADGKGLGTKFLRHIERTETILHLIDVMSEDITDKYQKIRAELEKYSKVLAEKPEIIVLTKTDTADPEIVEMQIEALKEAGVKTPIFNISAVAHENLTPVLREISKVVAKEKAKVVKEVPAEVIPIITPKSQGMKVKREKYQEFGEE
jgi:GTP-binding protein